MRTKLRSKITLLFMTFALLLAIPAVALASDVNVAVVDVDVAPANSTTLKPGGTQNITINMTVSGNQAGTATFEVYKDWTLSGGTFTGSNPQEFTVGPRSGGDPATTLSTTGKIDVASTQADGSFTLAAQVFDITNSNSTGAKLAAGTPSNYVVKVDGTKPTITLTTPANNASYIQNQSVTASYSCQDETGGSGLKATGGCVGDVPSGNAINTATAGPKSFTVTATDNAGNVQTVTHDYTVVSPDSTPPVITPNVVGTLGNNGWYTSDVTVSWSVVDDESAISSSTGCDSTTINSDTVGTTLTCEATSAGGTSSESVTIKRDATAPTGVSGVLARATADHNGWYNAPVGYSFSGSDATSGIAADGCTSGTYSSPDSATASVSGSCTDRAGNSTGATISGFKFDDTNPTLNPSVSPNPVLLNDTATATPNASDATSGVASQSCPAVDTSSEGANSVTCTATDNAGNTNSANANYNVRAYSFTGFSSPVDNGGVLNVAKAGQAIPLKWRLMDNGSPVTNLLSVSGVTTNITCDLGSTDNVEVYAAGSSRLQNLGDGYYQYNWKSPTSYAKSCKTLTLKGIGMTQQAKFQFTK